ncbi:MAG: PepSY-like domain-containing protein [Methylomicrobium sp.]
MKTKSLIIAAAAASWMVFGQANAEEKELNKSQVPKAVLEAFEKAYPNVKSVEFEKEMFQGKAAYEVEYKENGEEHEFLYSADGVLLQREEEIDINALPEAAVKAIEKAHPKAKIEEAEKVMNPNGALAGYEVEIKSAGKGRT